MENNRSLNEMRSVWLPVLWRRVCAAKRFFERKYFLGRPPPPLPAPHQSPPLSSCNEMQELAEESSFIAPKWVRLRNTASVFRQNADMSVREPNHEDMKRNQHEF